MDETTSRLAPGVVLDGSYELLSVLGSGGMGTVWRAQHRRLPKQVAVKVLKGAEQADPEVLARFRREAEIASRLEHPHIVDALDFNTLGDGTPYMVLELLTGQSLRARLQHGPLPLDEAIEIVRQVGSALAAAHAQGVVHRDLKPENIFLCVDDERVHAKVLDFGLSRITGGDTALTKAGAVFGTPLYMAPEQAQGTPADARSDQHALAMVLLEMLHGRPAFVAEQPLQVLFRIVHEPAPALAELCPSVPAAISAAVARALAKAPADRFPDVRSFVRALAGSLGIVESKSPSSPGTRAIPPEPVPLAATISGHEATVDLGSAETTTPLPKTLPPLDPGPSLPRRDPLPKTLPPLETSAAVLPHSVPTLQDPVESRRPRIGVGRAAFLGALGVGLVGGVVFWLTRAPSPSAAHHGQARDRGGVRALPATADAAATTTARDLRPAARDGGGSPDRTLRLDLRRTGRVMRAAPPLPESLAARLRAAESLLAEKRYSAAGVEGERLERDLPERHRWRASLIRVHVHCGLVQRPEAEGAYRRLPPAAQGGARRFCRRFIPDFNP